MSEGVGEEEAAKWLWRSSGSIADEEEGGTKQRPHCIGEGGRQRRGISKKRGGGQKEVITEPRKSLCTRLRESCRQVEADVIRNSSNKLHQTTYKDFFSALCVPPTISLTFNDVRICKS